MSDKQTSSWKVLLIIVISIFIFVWLFNVYENEQLETRKKQVEDYSTNTIEYYVDGACESASITYRNIQGGTEQLRDAVLPWSQKYIIQGKEIKNLFLSISAQNDCRSGSIISKIIYNGAEIKISKSDGAFVIASASTLIK